MLKTLSIVSTQMQLVNCVEYIMSSLTNDDTHYLIVCTGSDKRKEQIDSLLKYPFYSNVFSQIIHISIASGSKPFVYLKEIFFKYNLKRIIADSFYDIIIAGNYLSIYHRYVQFLCNNNNPDIKYVIVDDGTATSEAVLLRAKELSTGIIQCYEFSRFIRFYYLTINPTFYNFVPHSLVFFSVYNELEYPKEDSYQECNYNYTKQLDFGNIGDVVDFTDSNLVVIGQPLSAAGILEYSRYNEIILKYLSVVSVGQRSIIYVPHPSENVETSLNNELKNKVIIFRPNIPFELWALTRHVELLIGFYSSVLVNMRFLSRKIKIVGLCPKEIMMAKDLYFQEAQQAYMYFGRIGIDVCVL